LNFCPQIDLISLTFENNRFYKVSHRKRNPLLKGESGVADGIPIKKQPLKHRIAVSCVFQECKQEHSDAP
jgi:hypothetical protein